MSQSPRAFDLEGYIKVGLQLIPLHKWNAVDERKRPRGKTPRDGAWQARDYDSREVIKAMVERGINVGVRLPASVVVLDVDPRNFEDGVDSLAKLVKDSGLILDVAPHVITGSGGHHYYFRKPTDIGLLDTLEDYPGIEFKSLGRQVVAAGSIHPCGKHYEWDDFAPSLSEMPDMPEALLRMAKRPTRAHGDAAGLGELTPEMLAETLEQIDPDDFQGQDWQDLMMACHHATDGEGRSEFIEWSTRAAGYEDHGSIIGRRWDSLHANTGRGGRPVTIKYLHKVVQEAGGEVARAEPEDDFEPYEDPDEIGHGVDTEELSKDPTPISGPDAVLEYLNSKYCAVSVNGRFRIMSEKFDVGLKQKTWVYMSAQDFQTLYLNKTVQIGDKVVPYGKFWLTNGHRRTYPNGLVFDPVRDHDGYLNLWQGWGVEAKEGGTWELLDKLILNALAGGSKEYYEYIMNWLAYMVQEPNRPAEVALCFQGIKGVGKSTLGNVMCKLAGIHGLAVSNPRHLQGNFNSHLRSCILLFADEAFTKSGDDSAQAATLKQLITEPALFYEAKGVDGEMDRNRLHIIMASNSDWMVPTSLGDERRFAVFRVAETYKGDHEFFGNLHEELEKGGYEAFLHYLLNRPLKGWAPRKNVPQTEALSGQKKASMDHLQNWWLDVVEDGELEALTDKDNWEEGPIRVLRKELYDSYVSYVNMRRGTPKSRAMFDIQFARLLGYIDDSFKTEDAGQHDKLGGLRGKARITEEEKVQLGLMNNRPMIYYIPSLEDCVKRFSEFLGEESRPPVAKNEGKS